jgi:hypothetical protein
MVPVVMLVTQADATMSSFKSEEQVTPLIESVSITEIGYEPTESV